MTPEELEKIKEQLMNEPYEFLKSMGYGDIWHPVIIKTDKERFEEELEGL
jgi:hypothetical protein